VSTACGLATDGRVHCWDTWDAGRSAGEAPDATVLDTDLRFADLAVGWGHMCGLTAAGDLYCWGANLYGAVGTGSTEAVVAVPTMVASDVTFTAVAAGVSHTCAIADGGEVWCWGETWSGAVGAPGGEMCGASPGRTCTRSPLRVAGGHRFRQMAAGGGHTCGIDESGELLCWGLGHDGQLGHAPTGLCGMTVADLACSPAPTAVSGGLRWSAVSATSARTCAVAEDGGAWCWGRGELGDGTWAGSAVPRSVDVDTRFARIATGMDHSCGVGVDGVVWCWGMNTYGQIGDGSPSMGWPAPVAVRFFESG
jgi:alpha-tubulin suppressor-like RCC1 family protein